MIINLTPHELAVYADDTVAVTIPPSGTVARVAMSREQAGALQLGIVNVPIYTTVLGAVEGLPDPQPGVTYVVSRVVLDAARDRDDLVVPDDLVRDGAGRVVGCRAFAR